MLTIIKQSKDTLDKTLIKNIVESYNNYYTNNDYLEEVLKLDIDSLWNIIDVENIYIVVRNYRFIGFFIIKTHDANREVSFQIFLSSFACPKSNVSLTKCAVSSCLLMFTQNPGKYSFLEFVTGHPLLASAVKTMVPTLEITMITPRHIVCHREIQDQELNYFRTFIKSYMIPETPENYNSYELTR